MFAKTKAELVLVEPGAHANPATALAGATEQRHVLLFGREESSRGFLARVRHRADTLRRASQSLFQVTYLVGPSAHTDWLTRQSLLSQLCADLDPQGSVAVHAPRSASSDVFGCMESLQLSAPGLELRAVFADLS
jgi:hypothetical protein